MADRPVLDLTTTDPRPLVAIDKIHYPIRLADDLSLEQYRYLERVMPRTGELLDNANLTAEQGQELEALLVTLTPIALEAPAEVLAKLRPLQNLMVVQTFMTLSTPSIQAAAARAVQTGGPWNGTKPSPDSSGSTAATSARGSRKRR